MTSSGSFAPARCASSRQDVDRHGRLAADGPGRDAPGPAREEWTADAALERRPLAFAEMGRRPRMLAVTQPRPVVRGEHHQRILLQTVLLQRRQHLPDRPVQFHDHVAVQSLLRLALVFVRHEQRDVGHAVRQVEKEGFVLVLVDE